MSSTIFAHVYEVRPHREKRGVGLISDALPFGRLWYAEPNAIGYAKFRSRSHDAVIRVYDAAGNVIEAHKEIGEFERLSGEQWRNSTFLTLSRRNLSSAISITVFGREPSPKQTGLQALEDQSVSFAPTMQRSV